MSLLNIYLYFFKKVKHQSDNYLIIIIYLFVEALKTFLFTDINRLFY